MQLSPPYSPSHSVLRHFFARKCFEALAVLSLPACVFAQGTPAAIPPPPVTEASPYKVIWETPSKDAYGTMPLGNGEVGLNAWIDELGDLKFYIARIDSIDENGRLLKVGSVRVRVGEADVRRTAASFRQLLDTKRGVLEAEYGTGDEKVSLRLWVDANRPVIVVEAKTAKPVLATAHAELWRKTREKLSTYECSDLDNDSPYDRRKFPVETLIEPDTILKNQAGQIGWFHLNQRSESYQRTAAVQGTDDFPRENPILHRIFGAIVRCEHPNRIDDTTLQSKKNTTHSFEIAATTLHPSSEREWLADATRILDSTKQIPLTERQAKHEAWWNEFWSRSWIHFSQNKKAQNKVSGRIFVDGKELTPRDNSNSGQSQDASIMTRAYTLQRYVTACAGRGRYAIKYNGSLFTVPEKGKPLDADFRKWGPGYWFQNTREMYFSMPASGDFEMMQPFFSMYFDILELCKYWTKKYLGHGGAFYPECILFWGDVFLETYGYTPWDKRKEKLQVSGYHKYEWVGGLEIANMMLEYYEYTGDEKFLNEKAIPFTKEILTFFDQHYSVNANGRLVMTPAQAVETWWDCTNPMPEVAGLHSVVQKMQQLPENLLSAELKQFTAALKEKLPPIPTMTSRGGKLMLAPGERFAKKKNSENPELYAVFPFRLISYEKPNLEWGLEALKRRQDRGFLGWRQDELFMAYLGLANEARDGLLKRAKKKHPPSRFPVFWGPNYDWTPDQCHGGVLTKGVQSLVMQCDGKRIDLFPAFPADWDCDFKLHAPYQTVIEGKLIGGKISSLKVTPKEREKDVRILIGKDTGR